MKRLSFFIAGLFFLTLGYAQADSCTLRISMLTCGPGDDLYSIFGHTAVRVSDRARGTDIIYNYGTFDFDDPDFYIKFVRGKLLYNVSVERYDQFVAEYAYERRSVIEQVLNLSCQEKEQLFHALQVNAREENKYYQYEYLFDNCSTRVRDIIRRNTQDSVHFREIRPVPAQTFRKMLHDCLDNGDQLWSKLGIDLALGSLIDRLPTNEEAMFLPDYLMKGYDSAFMKNVPVTASKRIIFPARPHVQGQALFTPINTTTALLVVILVLTLLQKNWSRKFLDFFDVTLFFLTGGVGSFLVFMWFGTEQDLCAYNYNLLWALPTHLFISFFILKNRPWVRTYFKISTVFYLLVIAGWALIPQGMNAAFLPLAILLGVRSFARPKKKSTDA